MRTYRCAVLAITPPDLAHEDRVCWLKETESIAQRWQWPYFCRSLSACFEDKRHIEWKDYGDPDVLMWRDAQGWSVSLKQEAQWLPLRFDLTQPAFVSRLRRAGARSEGLLKALGRTRPQSVLDCTGGTGEESLLLARVAQRVTTLERDPVIAVLLQDALARARKHPVLSPLVERIDLVLSDARDVLREKAQKDVFYDVIYCDPMFPVRRKSAQVNKIMQLFHHLLGSPEDPSSWVQEALRVADRRVIVKRPSGAPCVLNEPKPHYAVTTDAVRFDVYLCRDEEV